MSIKLSRCQAVLGIRYHVVNVPRCHIFKVSEVSRCSGVWGVKVFKLLSHDVSPGAVVGGQEVARGGVHQLPGEGLLGEAHLVVGVAHKLGSETLVV